MKLGIYKSNVCKNQLLRRVINNQLQVDLVEHCSWCCHGHKFELFEIYEEREDSKNV